MADREYSSYQKKVISRYYDNREQIDAQKLSELVTNLYLADGKKRDKMWARAEDLMTRLKGPAGHWDQDFAGSCNGIGRTDRRRFRILPECPRADQAKQNGKKAEQDGARIYL